MCQAYSFCIFSSLTFVLKILSFDIFFLNFRIPSNTSVASRGSSAASSIDHLQVVYPSGVHPGHHPRSLSKCGSPLPQYTVQYLLPDGRAELQKIPRK